MIDQTTLLELVIFLAIGLTGMVGLVLYLGWRLLELQRRFERMIRRLATETESPGEKHKLYSFCPHNYMIFHEHNDFTHCPRCNPDQDNQS